MPVQFYIFLTSKKSERKSMTLWAFKSNIQTLYRIFTKKYIWKTYSICVKDGWGGIEKYCYFISSICYIFFILFLRKNTFVLSVYKCNLKQLYCFLLLRDHDHQFLNIILAIKILKTLLADNLLENISFRTIERSFWFFDCLVMFLWFSKYSGTFMLAGRQW